MKRSEIWCPACMELYKKMNGDSVVICSIIYRQFEAGMSNFPNYTILPEHCEGSKYTFCDIWREEKEKNWKRNLGDKYSSLAQSETLRL